MVAPFDAAWSMLKALEEQQIQDRNIRYTDYPESIFAPERTLIQLLRNKGRGSGTMHPAIQGMLARRGTADAYRGDGSGLTAYRYNEGQDPIDAAAQMSRGSVFSRIGEQGRPEVFKMAPMMGGQMPKEDNGVEEYSHKDLDPEALIDFLVETMKMPYRDAKALTMSHKTKELVEANHRKGRLAARNQSGEAPMQGGY
tara:strand:+ start:333 stop:926 length:594 start_codon:yes stop_codon:yes gene_type:complete